MDKRLAAAGILVSCLLSCLYLPSVIGADFDQLMQEGMQAYEIHDNAQSATKFEEASKLAKPGTEDEFKAARSLLLPLGQMGDRDRLWQAKKRVCVLDHQLHGAAIPDEFAGDALPSAKEATGQSAAVGADQKPEGLSDAIKLYNSGKCADARSKLEAIKKAGKADAETHMYLGACYQALKKYKPALAEYDWVAKNSPLFSLKTKATTSARKLRDAMAGICPGDCLKLTTPGWQHLPGQDPKELFLVFHYAQGGWQAFSTHHLGEVVKFENGAWVNKGKCPICGGTGRVTPLQ